MSDEEWLNSKSVEHRLRVRYAETDQAGIVYHANYLIWFHEARDVAFRVWGDEAKRCKSEKWPEQFETILAGGRAIGSDTLEEIGYRFLVIEASCRYLSPARYGDEVIVTAVLQKTSVAKMTFAFTVRNARTQRMLAEGKTSSAIINRAGKMLIRMPPEFSRIFHESEARP